MAKFGLKEAGFLAMAFLSLPQGVDAKLQSSQELKQEHPELKTLRQETKTEVSKLLEDLFLQEEEQEVLLYEEADLLMEKLTQQEEHFRQIPIEKLRAIFYDLNAFEEENEPNPLVLMRAYQSLEESMANFMSTHHSMELNLRKKFKDFKLQISQFQKSLEQALLVKSDLHALAEKNDLALTHLEKGVSEKFGLPLAFSLEELEVAEWNFFQPKLKELEETLKNDFGWNQKLPLGILFEKLQELIGDEKQGELTAFIYQKLPQDPKGLEKLEKTLNKIRALMPFYYVADQYLATYREFLISSLLVQYLRGEIQEREIDLEGFQIKFEDLKLYVED